MAVRLQVLERLLRSVVSVSSLMLAACSSTTTAKIDKQCTSGEQIECPCVGGAKGAQVCKDDGTGFDACICPDSGAATGGSTAVGGSGGMSGSAGATANGGTSAGGTTSTGGTTASGGTTGSGGTTNACGNSSSSCPANPPSQGEACTDPAIQCTYCCPDGSAFTVCQCSNNAWACPNQGVCQ